MTNLMATSQLWPRLSPLLLAGLFAFLVVFQSGDQVVLPRKLTTTPGIKFFERISCQLPLSYESSNGSHTNSNESSQCVLFSPERFFATSASIYKQAYDYSKEVKTEHPVVKLSLKSDSKSSNNENSDDNLPQLIIYFHIRKCGGTTMFRSLTSKSLRIPYHAQSYNRYKIKELGIVQDVYNKQKYENNEREDAIVFSFVRDPVIRFLSSIGQMVHMNRVRLFSKCSKLQGGKNATLEESQKLIECVLDSIKSGEMDSGNKDMEYATPMYDYIDQHMLPQAFELRARSLGMDIKIHLMDITKIATTLKTLVRADKQNRHARSSRVESYTQGHVLEPSILTPSMIHDICTIYAVDVLMLKMTGVATTMCDSDVSIKQA